MPLIHRKKNQHEEDGSAEKEKEQHEQEERKSMCPLLLSLTRADQPEWEGEEYDVLLRFVKQESERLKSAKSNAEDEEEESTYKRVWYAPWRKVKVGGSAFKASLEYERRRY